MERLEEILSYGVGENTVYDFALALILFIGILVVFQIFKKIAISRLKKIAKTTKNDLDDEIIKIIGNISPVFYFIVAIYFPLKMLVMGDGIERVLDGIFVVVIVYQVIRVLQSLIEYGLRGVAERKAGKGEEARAAFQGIRLVIKIVLWSVGILLILSNLGINITTLVASLGVGGIAVALAMQNILGDMFSSFSIYFDKPFVVGDYIVVGDHDGIVKKIGLKTTRLETLQGEELIISNNELTSARIQNFRRMKRRRVSMKFGIVYEISGEKLRKANEIVKKVMDGIDGIELDRCHFVEFGDFSLNFEVVYYVESGEYSVYLDKQEEINFAVKEAFEKEGIGMAYPTQTVYMGKES